MWISVCLARIPVVRRTVRPFILISLGIMFPANREYGIAEHPAPTFLGGHELLNRKRWLSPISALLFTLPVICAAWFLDSCTKNPAEPKPTTGNISGQVLDRASASPIVGAQITTTPVTVSRVTGTNGDYSIAGIAPAEYTVRAIKDGYQENSVTVDVTVGQTATADIPLSVLTPQLHVQPDVLDFSTATTTLPLTVQNSTGVGTLTWAGATDQQWLSISPTTGTLTTNIQQVTVTVNRTGLQPGNNYGNVTITSNGGSISIGVVMVVINPNAPQLSVNLQHLDFDSVTSTRDLVLSNTGTGTLTWSLVDDQNWLSDNPTSGNIGSGATSTVQVNVDRAGLQQNSYSGNLAISSNGGNMGVSVSMHVPSGGALPAPILNAPTNVQETSVSLTWTRITQPSFAFYRVYDATHSGVTESDIMVQEIHDSGTNRCTVSNLLAGTQYFFKVYVYNSAGSGTPSNEVTATTSTPLGTWVSTGVISGAGNLKDIWPVSDNEVFALSDSGAIYRWNGSGWNQEAIPPGYASSSVAVSLSFLDSQNGWALYNRSSGNNLLHYDGQQWSVVEGSAFSSCQSMVSLGINNIWIGRTGQVQHWDGSSWHQTAIAGGDFSGM